jgi:uncharacterized membrane protein YkgB
MVHNRENWGMQLIRWSQAILLLWFGVFKFTQTEAKGIEDLLANSPFTSFLLHIFSLQTVSDGIGIFEIVAAVLLLCRYFSVTLGRIGAALCILIFAVTVSFLFSTPGTTGVVEGIFILKGGGGFLFKDLAFLGFSIYAFGEARQRVK